MSRRWFEVDHDGLAELAKRRGMAFIVTEPIQNAWDEAKAFVSVELTPTPGLAKSDLTVSDDSPTGFRDLTDSFMMFRSSYKLDHPEKRGRFNVGEKLLLSVADHARIASTTGTVIFSEKGRTRSAAKTEAGSVLTARLRMTRAEHEEALVTTRMLIPPTGIRTRVNGEELPQRVPVATAKRSLMTEVRGEEGGFQYRWRQAEVRLYEPLPGEKPHVYEMGIPIDEVECAWHIEVMQKVPLSLDRNSLQYGFVDDLRRAAGEMMAAAMSADQARESWVSSALDNMTDDDAVRAIVKARFGKAVTYDPSAPEANKMAVDAGYKLVTGAELSKAAWGAVRRAEALQPAGRVFDDGRVRSSPNGVPPIPYHEWTKAMKRLADYVRGAAEHCLGHAMAVEFYKGLDGFTAFCGHKMVAFNLSAPGMRKAVDGHQQEYLDQIIIHELAHDKVSDHLTHDYHRECCRIGARLRSYGETL